ncbi:cytochrome C biogenesis protein [Candidatus Roizmanbacteria bacterium RIFOXYB2_FULL_38_10]|uniref:Cytochrome C biogenesis protein n=1 Tax=Candidatus Roizmanbacteria bacterium RIFOXYD1_FULL_38_12 TaxID=1802093 RepID=A0A1F7KZJ8_9BACT|nr:MAG: cytochrome C biogenesis protein [Candidatus Roizmanbacteria bacterium RIFOXYA2_FULL_38_14]OGK63310.1 MAG: cytochrome C biogenesis protein [Candidatus Roizmanbacteria bacterium RIFOXYA1_FULL_37_12]OGK65156.1 MAG: cytochrome C biogenesis protein [Candidatus Roizmanbacteria bacterium RIFOXYB1_FULL_40_23]OGK68711.1 MAG: cytochrome C biogenesis protein [Candidatus Roizmanbacteria bacterium RIFOXYB2_FULL_38_10]OGK69560.1 MAG: cytochrome C biogenesis protein [Candidatus Roizmanbacteria bacteri
MDLTRLIYGFIDSHNIPLLSAFLIGLLTSISPCPLATNITAIAYISKDIKKPKNTVLNGLFYTFGRVISYSLLAILIYFGLSTFKVSRLFQGWGDKVLGPILIILGLIMLDVIKLNIKTSNPQIEKFKVWIATKGFLGALLLGMLFAFAFCPYSGVLFFGVLIPLILKSKEALLLPPLFALGTGLPVILFSFLIAFSMKRMSKAFAVVSKIEKVTRYIVSIIFIGVGLFYLQYLINYLVRVL